MKTPQRTLLLVASACAVLSIAGCASDPAPAASAGGDGELTPIRVQLTNVVSGQSLIMGEKAGLFAEEGLEIDFVEIQDTAAATAALQSESLDLAFSPFVGVLQMSAQGIPVSIVAPADGYEEGQVVESDEEAKALDATAVYASASSGITTPADLEGRTIAVPSLSSQADATIDSVLREQGVDTSGIEWIKLDFQPALTSLENDQIDAAFLVSPFTVQAENAGLTHVLSPGVRFFEEGAVSGWFSTSAYADAHPEIIEAFQRAVVASSELVNADPEAAVQEVIDRTGMELTPDQLPTPYWPATIDLADIERMQQKLVDVGFLDEPLDLDAVVLPQAAQ
jgi:NitT/TauT family transport system substrate-binding protein